MYRVFLITLLVFVVSSGLASAQDMTCADYLEVRQGDVDYINDLFETQANNVGEMLEIYIILYTVRHTYEDMDPPECAEHLHDLMIAQIAADQDVAGLALNPFFDEERIRGEMEPIGDRIQRIGSEIDAEVERIEAELE